jgi:hypothetical protein
VSAKLPPVAWLLNPARAEVAALPPGSRAVVDQNAAYLRHRLAVLGLPADADALAAFALGAVEVAVHAHQTGNPAATVARDLVRSAAQLAAPLADPGRVAALQHALSEPERWPQPPRC